MREAHEHFRLQPYLEMVQSYGTIRVPTRDLLKFSFAGAWGSLARVTSLFLVAIIEFRAVLIFR